MLLRFSVLLLFGSYYASAVKPTETTLNLVKATGDPDSLSIGQKSTLSMTATFSEATTGVVIELLPSVNETVFAIGDIINMAKGDELSVTEGNWATADKKPGKEYSTETDSIVYNTRGVFTIGNVTFRTGQSDFETDYQITIEYEVVMTSIGNNVNGGEFMTSSGMEYGDYIWISQLSYLVLDTVASVSEVPSVVCQDVSTITIGEPLTVDVTMTIPYVQSTLKIEALDMENTNDIYVTRMRVKNVGSAFGYQLNLNNTDLVAHECPLKTSLEYQIGPIINKESQSTNSDPASYEIVVEITFLSRATLDIVDNEYTIAIALDINSEEIWVTSFVLTAVSTTILTFSDAVIQSAEVPPVSPGFVEEVTIDIDMPEKLEKQFTVSLTTEALNGAVSALSLVAVRQTFYGTNLVCVVTNTVVDFSASVENGPKDVGLYTFTLSNYGFNDVDNTNKNKLTLGIVVMIKPNSGVLTNDSHKLSIDVSGTGVQEKIITVGEPGTYPDSVNYLFEVTNSCPTNTFETGSSIMFDVIVTTERNVTAGPMTVEAPIPSSITKSNLQFCGAKIKDVGRNAICAQTGPINPTLSSWLNDGVEDHAAFTFDVMCNMQDVDDVNEDKFTIEIIVQIKDTVDILQSGGITNETFGIGISYANEKLIWVASYEFDIDAQFEFTEIDFVQDLVIMTDDLVDAQPSPSLTVQWSPDGLHFHDFPLLYDIPQSAGNETHFPLTTSLATKYVRLSDKPCFPGCRPVHHFQTQPGNEFIQVPFGTDIKKDLLRAYFTFALDKDNTTCFDLPVKSNSNTLPALWVVMNDTRIRSSFTLSLTGKGITCNTPGGPQVTIPMVGADTGLNGGLGKNRKCTFISEEGDSALKSCHYECPCFGPGCNFLTIFMLNKEETPVDPYQLCEVTISS